MNAANQIQANKNKFNHQHTTRRKEEELYRRMLFLNLTKDESLRRLDIPVIHKDISVGEEKTLKELILSFI